MCKLGQHKNPFGPDGPSSKWFRGFLKRHYDVKESRASSQTNSRSIMSTQETMDNFFATYGNLLSPVTLLYISCKNQSKHEMFHLWKCVTGEAIHELNLQDKPQCIFNVDETGHNDRECQNTEKVIGIRGKTTKQNQVCKQRHNKNLCNVTT